MRTAVWAGRVAVACGLLAAGGCRREKEEAPAPLTPSVREMTARGQARRLDIDLLLAWSRGETPLQGVRTAVDTLPNGLAIAMAPLLVDWNRSDGTEDGTGAYLVHNVIVGGNPARGQLIFGSIRIPADGVKSVEWNNVVARMAGRDTSGGHGQIRLIFHADKRPQVLTRTGEPLTADALLDDLVFSWEAWRPPATRWDPIQGFDPETYALTVRCYGGAQRFLMDALRDSAWECYPLDLAGVPGAAHDILRTCLVMGDALARRTVQAIAESIPPDALELEAARRTELEALVALDAMPDEPITHLMGEADLSYHLLLRSCITQALTALDLARQVAHVRLNGPESVRPPRIQVAPESLPAWMDDLPNASRPRILARVPATAYWVAKNQTVLPANAYQILEEAGMLQRADDGEPVRYYYRIDRATPYGLLRDNILY